MGRTVTLAAVIRDMFDPGRRWRWLVMVAGLGVLWAWATGMFPASHVVAATMSMALVAMASAGFVRRRQTPFLWRATRLSIAGVIAALIATAPAQAALHGRLPATPGGTDYQAYWDDVLHITWSADANLAATNTFGLPTGTSLGRYPGDPSVYKGFIYSSGVMNWPGARFWIDAMNADSGTGYLGYDDWRLATALNQDGSGPCLGYSCTDSEMGYMYYTNLGNSPGGPLTNTGPFANLLRSGYWSGTEYGPDPAEAWYFYFAYGGQFAQRKGGVIYAWAVRPGDVAIPEPTSVMLLVSGMVLLVVLRK